MPTIQQPLLKLVADQEFLPPSKPLALYLSNAHENTKIERIEYADLSISDSILYTVLAISASLGDSGSRITIQHRLTLAAWAYEFFAMVNIQGNRFYKYTPSDVSVD